MRKVFGEGGRCETLAAGVRDGRVDVGLSNPHICRIYCVWDNACLFLALYNIYTSRADTHIDLVVEVCIPLHDVVNVCNR